MNIPRRNQVWAGLALLACGLALMSARRVQAAAESTVYVDDNGVMRWRAGDAEVALFGVNYTTPFAHAFRAHRRLGVSWREAIDADVYHFARLGFDAYRVHVWDREISDAEGNLLANEHVEALDYLLAKLKERGIKTILTPLQFGNAGYPEPGVPLPGFSSAYGKLGSLEDRTSWPLQERYLAQFASHVNPHTGLAYKDDPDVIAFEICNEPGHFEHQTTLEYINRMVQALRDAGVRTPIFYNMSHGWPVFDAYLDANVQGGTFQWYPASLLAGHDQRGNFLPYVDRYPIPFAEDPRFQTKAKMVYEFDAADIGRAYMYPAMARTFRSAGMQFVTQFAYDPLFIAPFNTEYQTHYLNLAYAPQKALGMKIAAEAFRRVPRGRDYGSYPENTSFEGVHVNHRQDLTEFVTEEQFFHSNDTATRPPNPRRLREVAGYGDSPLVNYPGRGAYFLNQLEPGVWRLEVMPDAIPVHDPFSETSPRKHMVRIAWAEWPMSIRLPDLGADFVAAGLNEGNSRRADAREGTIQVGPGTYLLTRRGVNTPWASDRSWRNIKLGEFVAPPASIDQTYVLHEPPRQATANDSLRITAVVAAAEPVEEVRLVYYPPETFSSLGEGAPRPANPETGRPQPGRFNTPGTGVPDTGGAQALNMAGAGYDYAAAIPAEHLSTGVLRYYVAVRRGEGWTTLPGGDAALPTDWDFVGEPWTVQIVPKDAPLLLFDAAEDFRRITANRREVLYGLVPSDRPGLVAMEMIAGDLARAEHDHSFRIFFRDQLRARLGELPSAQKLVLYGRAKADAALPVQLALVTAEGVAYGAMATIEPRFGAYEVSLGELRPVPSPNIPHGYPVFIPFWSEPPPNAASLDLAQIESVLVSIGPGLNEAARTQTPGILIERIWLE